MQGLTDITKNAQQEQADDWKDLGIDLPLPSPASFPPTPWQCPGCKHWNAPYAMRCACQSTLPAQANRGPQG